VQELAVKIQVHDILSRSLVSSRPPGYWDRQDMAATQARGPQQQEIYGLKRDCLTRQSDAGSVLIGIFILIDGLNVSPVLHKGSISPDY